MKTKNRFNIYIITVLIVGAVAISLILVFSMFAKNYFVNSNKILYELNLLENAENRLNYKILYSSLYLYYDNDIIADEIHRIRKLIKIIENIPFYKEHYPQSYRYFEKYKKAFFEKENMIFEFLRFSLPIKNSLIYLGNSLKVMDLDRNTSHKVFSILSAVFLAKSAIDKDFIKFINLNDLKNLKTSKNRFNRAFYLNLSVFLRYFPKYQQYLQRIINYPTLKYLDKSIESFMMVIKDDVRIFKLLSYVLALFIGILIIALMLLIDTLNDKIFKISLLLQTDPLTNLPNRYRFNMDIQKKENVSVIIFNIDKFKNINDIFGVKIGDLVLKKVASSLKKFFKEKKLKVYRIGADDFAVIVNSTDKKYVIDLAKKAINMLEKDKIKIGESDINVTLSAGITFNPPYLENADLALKHIKTDVKEKIGIYQSLMGDIIYENINMSKEIKEAIDKENVFSYFQPIFDKYKNIVKYEVLCRIKIGNEIKSIYPYLSLLKENKMYHKITEIMLRNSLKVLQRYPLVSLSINLSIEDVMNKDIVEYIKFKFTDKNIAKRITFEILESEIASYDLLQEFIKEMHKFGIKFAIDDFGSGYSNFSRVLKLNIDYLKIDGSLIKNVDKKRESRLIVETIVDFANKSGIKTIAEYVHSKEIFDTCRQIGIDYFQGFYLEKPKPNINL